MTKELRLDYCDECMQMTNHLDDECQKCKAKEKGIVDNKYEEYEDEYDEEYQKKRAYFEEDEEY